MQVEGQCLLFRADASIEIGTGHVMRCLALAQAWQAAGGRVVFAQAATSPALEARLRTEGIEVVSLRARPGTEEDAAQTTGIAREHGVDWIVADGYRFGSAYQQGIKAAGLRLLLVDDYGHAEHYHADLILNQNIHANDELYGSREPYTRLLLGTRYALLRREFREWRGWQRQIPPVARKVLVTLGGADPQNVTLKIVRALGQVDVEGLEVAVVVGGSNPHREVLEAAVRDVGRSIRLLRDVPNMPELMAWADVAVAGGGSTCWELAFMGLPGLLVVLADNQRQVALYLDRAGVFINLGSGESLLPQQIADSLTHLLQDSSLLTQMSRRGSDLVDGEGGERVIQRMRTHRLILRPAREEDGRQLWIWANAPEVRAVSFSSDAIPWEQHLAWLHARLRDSECRLYIAMDEAGTPVGQVRFDITGDRATISIGLDSACRGRGYGTELIRLACDSLWSTSGARQVDALIKPDNTASLRAFEKAGWENCGNTIVNGQQAIRFVWRRGVEHE